MVLGTAWECPGSRHTVSVCAGEPKGPDPGHLSPVPDRGWKRPDHSPEGWGETVRTGLFFKAFCAGPGQKDTDTNAHARALPPPCGALLTLSSVCA